VIVVIVTSGRLKLILAPNEQQNDRQWVLPIICLAFSSMKSGNSMRVTSSGVRVAKF
jgi:hypothetical protein